MVWNPQFCLDMRLKPSTGFQLGKVALHFCFPKKMLQFPGRIGSPIGNGESRIRITPKWKKLTPICNGFCADNEFDIEIIDRNHTVKPKTFLHQTVSNSKWHRNHLNDNLPIYNYSCSSTKAKTSQPQQWCAKVMVPEHLCWQWSWHWMKRHWKNHAADNEWHWKNTVTLLTMKRHWKNHAADNEWHWKNTVTLLAMKAHWKNHTADLTWLKKLTEIPTEYFECP